MVIVYIVIVISFLCCLISTPFVIAMCKKHGLVDIPKDSRRVHSKPMPRSGGIAIYASTMVALLVYYFYTRNTASIALNMQFWGYMIGALLMFLMGIIDDIFTLKARYKTIFEVAAIVIVYIFGIRLVSIGNLPLGFMSFPLTFLWIITVQNAMNLIDGLDGLAAGLTSISALALLMLFISTSASLEAIIITAAVVGASLGFLPYNFNPAKTFMGDCSSNFLGFTMACVTLLGFSKGYTAVEFLAPVLILGVPIFDTVFAMVRRAVKHRPLFAPDAGHIHHRLIRAGFTQRQAVLILYTVTSTLCIIAVSLITTDIWKLALLIGMSTMFIVLWIASMIRTKDSKVDSTVNANFAENSENASK